MSKTETEKLICQGIPRPGGSKGPFRYSSQAVTYFTCLTTKRKRLPVKAKEGVITFSLERYSYINKKFWLFYFSSNSLWLSRWFKNVQNETTRCFLVGNTKI